MGGFKFFFIVVIVVTALTSALCFFKAVESTKGGLILKWEVDEEIDTYELTELPQLSRGKYIHDFKMNKTLILDEENDRCFIMELNRNEIKPPRDFMEFISRLENGIYQLNLNEVRHDTRVVFPPLDNVSWLKYGVPIANNCQKRTSYLLEEVEKILEKRSASEVPAPSKFIEFGGESFITYNIVNLKEV